MKRVSLLLGYFFYFAPMNRSQWITLIAVLIIAIACFMPWVTIDMGNITVSGVDEGGTRYGKGAYSHFILIAAIIVFTFIPKIWAKRFNIFFAVLNLAWAIKNFLLLGRCEAGECPHRQIGIYLVLLMSIVLMITALFPQMKIDTAADD